MGGIMMPYMSTMGAMGYVAPSQIPNLSLWYNGSTNQTSVNNVLTNNFQTSPLADGTEVTKWKDLSGLGQDANVNSSTGGTGPLYKVSIQNSLSSLLYSSANKTNLDINPLGTWPKLKSGFTIYIVGKWTSLPASAVQVAVTDYNLGHQWTGSYWQVGAAAGLATAQSTTVSTSAYTMHGMIFDGSYTNADVNLQNAGRLVYRYNKAQQTLTFSANVGTQTSNSATVFYVGGNNRNTPKSYMDGYFGELMIWTRALTSLEISQVETYVSQKWGF